MADATPDTAPNAGDQQLALPVLPLPNGVVLPGMVLTVALESDEAKAAVAATGDDDRLLLVPKVDGRHASVGTIATIESRGELPSGAPALVVRATDRALLRAGVAGTGTVLWLQAEPVDPEVTDEAR
ncbi:MAG: LON peptidase substrate-binding domain-containing protein, partial [Acidimicrobiales bacterium]|nr:LON peptidase substrate-binding domain-containing protein [Acidimicrobiales bacterium]